jgi:hypothetical protein
MFYIPNIHQDESLVKGIVPALLQLGKATDIGYLYLFGKSFWD